MMSTKTVGRIALRKALWVAALVPTTMAFTGTFARADMFVFTSANSGILGNNTVSSPYANLTVTGNTSTGVVLFSLTLANNNPALFHELGFDINPASGVSTSNFTMVVTGGGFTNSVSSPTGGAMDGFGKFDVIGALSGSSNDRATSITVELDFKSGFFGEAVASNFEYAGSTGGNTGSPFMFAADYFPTSGGTGFVGVPSGQPGGGLTGVPEPSSLLLMGLSSVGLGLFGLRRRVRTAS